MSQNSDRRSTLPVGNRRNSSNQVSAAVSLTAAKKPGDNLTVNERPLTAFQKEQIWKAIYSKVTLDDRDPEEVIAKDFNGDEETYLKLMARWHGLTIAC